MAHLMIKESGRPERRFELSGDSIIAGRESACDLTLEEPAASRRHARIHKVGQHFEIEDLGSSNGTRVNGRMISNAILSDGDVITIHEARIVFCAPGTASSDDAPKRVHVIDVAPGSELITISKSSHQFDLPQQRLEMLYQLCGRLTCLRETDELLEDAMDYCFQTFTFERGAIAIRTSDGRGLDWSVVRNLRGSEGDIAVSQTLLRRALEYGERCVLGEGTANIQTDSIVRLGIRSAMCVPLMHDEQTLGVIYGDRVRGSSAYDDQDLDFLFGLARLVSIGLINNRLMQEQKRQAKLENDIRLAREIQQFFFPGELTGFSGLTVAASNEPGERISGDYYDVFELSDHRVGFLMADVTGKGVAASLIMANLQGAVRATLDRVCNPADAMAYWNDLICRNTDGMNFITCMLGVIDPATRRVELATAGHHPPYLIREADKSCRQLDVETGLPLGIDESVQYKTTTIALEPSDALYAFTDGVTEAMSVDKEEFGDQRLVDALSSPGSTAPAALIESVRDGIARFVGAAAQHDDITMLAIRV